MSKDKAYPESSERFVSLEIAEIKIAELEKANETANQKIAELEKTHEQLMEKLRILKLKSDI